MINEPLQQRAADNSSIEGNPYIGNNCIDIPPIRLFQPYLQLAGGFDAELLC